MRLHWTGTALCLAVALGGCAYAPSGTLVDALEPAGTSGYVSPGSELASAPASGSTASPSAAVDGASLPSRMPMRRPGKPRCRRMGGPRRPRPAPRRRRPWPHALPVLSFRPTRRRRPATSFSTSRAHAARRRVAHRRPRRRICCACGRRTPRTRSPRSRQQRTSEPPPACGGTCRRSPAAPAAREEGSSMSFTFFDDARSRSCWYMPGCPGRTRPTSEPARRAPSRED